MGFFNNKDDIEKLKRHYPYYMEIEEKTYYPDDEELKKILGWLFRDNIRKIYCPYFLRFYQAFDGTWTHDLRITSALLYQLSYESSF